jgi:hypothetical protein
MTKSIHQKNNLIVAIAPSSRGFGFAVLEGRKSLVDWGVRSVTGNKNAGSIKKADALIAHYHPAVLVLQDAAAKGSRRSPRIRILTKKLAALAASRKVKVALFSREQVMQAFFEDGKGTKHAIARLLAGRFPAELGHRLPPKRRDWESEDYRMGIFDAMALAFTKWLDTNRRH